MALKPVGPRIRSQEINDNLSFLYDETKKRATKEYVEEQVASIGDASPRGVFSTLTALQAAFPNGASGVYLVTANGHWYYWNGSAWTDGGVYQAIPWAEFITTQNETWEV